MNSSSPIPLSSSLLSSSGLAEAFWFTYATILDGNLAFLSFSMAFRLKLSISVQMVRQKAVALGSSPREVTDDSAVLTWAQGHQSLKSVNILTWVASVSLVSASFSRCVPKMEIFPTRRPCALIVWMSSEISTRARKLAEVLNMSLSSPATQLVIGLVGRYRESILQSGAQDGSSVILLPYDWQALRSLRLWSLMMIKFETSL